ncbi:ExeA family protein [Roseovarius sp. M141]|uniref:ExeA family protein n=1 Tax=Roseovarius sp. M141 TaxID=2583806 RepID=UPI0020CFA46F|nr:AAA family ATPase [Roseovarius sp. M141]MCQ0092511.1 hypothetical protein [Roseovarius sp. M141]
MVPVRPHKTVCDALIKAIEGPRINALVTGDWGSGKTLIAQSILDRYADRDRVQIAFPMNCPETKDDVITNFARQLQDAQVKPSAAWDSVASALGQAKSAGVKTLLMVDEAQALSPSAGEGFARLAQYSRANDLDLHLVLFGQTEFGETLKRAEFARLNSLITLRLHIDGLADGETKDYVTERLRLAGVAAPVFSDEALQLIEDACHGNPRRISKLCEILLFLARGADLSYIDGRFTRHVLINNVSPENMSLTKAVVELDDTELAADVLKDLDKEKPANIEPPATPAINTPHETVSVVPPRETGVVNAPERMAEDVASQTARNWIKPAFGVAVAAGLAGVLFVSIPTLQPDTLIPLKGSDDPATAGEQVITAAAENLSDLPSPDVPARYLGPDVLPADSGADQDGDADFLQAIESDSLQQAAILFSLAALHGHGAAATYLGQLYATGDGVVFSPIVAARWDAVANGERDRGALSATDDAQVSAPSSEPLFARVSGGKLDLVWDGAADSFRVELADADGGMIGYFETPLTAARIDLAEGATAWRVRADSRPFSAWLPIAN